MTIARTEYGNLFAIIGGLYGAPPDEPEDEQPEDDKPPEGGSHIPGMFTTNDAVGNREDLS